MKKSEMIWQQYHNKMAEVKDLQAKNEIEKAYEVMNEAKALEIKAKVAEDEEEEEANSINPLPSKGTVENKTIIAFNKAVLGKPLNAAEGGLVERIGEDGGYLVPIEQRNQIEELKRALIPLKQYCNIIPVRSLSGQMPLEVDNGDKLIEFAELTQLNESGIKFGQVKWELKDYGDIIPISNQLLQDETANLTNYVGRRFAKKAVRTENAAILAILATAKAVGGADYTAINTALNKELDPALSVSAIIVTNQTGFDYLDSLIDGNGRPLLTVSLADATRKLYKGRPVVVLSDAEFGSSESVFYVGDMASFVAFFDRNVYEMAVSTEAGFTKYATLLRCVERFDVKPVDTKAMVKVTLTVAAPEVFKVKVEEEPAFFEEVVEKESKDKKNK